MQIIILVTQIFTALFILFIYFRYFNNYLLDFPNTTIKTHSNPTPYLGGIILLSNLAVIGFFYYFFNQSLINDSELLIKHLGSRSFLVIFFFNTLFLILLGLYDDVYDLNYLSRLILTSLIIYFSIMIYPDLQIIEININPFSNINIENLSIPITILCFLTLINILNFYDGINGQSSIYISFVLVYIYFKSGFPVSIYLMIPIIIFLILNLMGKSFMGDSGIYGYSYLIGLLFIISFNNSLLNVEEIVLITLLPFLDLLRLCYSRIIRGHSPFLGDKFHIHHLINHSNSLLNTNIFLIIIFSLPIFLYLAFEIFYLNIIIFILIYLLLIRYFKIKLKNEPRK